MTRFGDGDDEWDARRQALWTANLRRALAGKRGQAALAFLEQALLELPDKVLIDTYIVNEGMVCALGAMALKRCRDRGMDMETALEKLALDAGNVDNDWESADFGRSELGLTYILAWEIAYQNDEVHWSSDARRRYINMLNWTRWHLGKPPVDAAFSLAYGPTQARVEALRRTIDDT